jgi:signal transduction histidine kinase
MTRGGAGARTGVLAAVALAAGVGGAASYARTGASTGDVVRDLAVGWTFAAAGLIAWWRRPANSAGKLMVAEGVTWFVGNVQGTGVPLLVGLGAWFDSLNLAVLAHLALSFPDGRLAGRAARAAAGAAYGLVAVFGLLRTAVYDPAAIPAATYLSCRGCDTNALLIHGDPHLFDAVDVAYRGLGGLLSLVCVAMVVRRWRRSSRPRRQALLPAMLAIACAAVFLLWDVILHAASPELRATASAPLLLASDLSQTAVPVAFLVGLLRLRLRRAAVGSLVFDVGADPTPRRLREALASALDDPSLQLGLWQPDAARYVDPDGRPLPAAPGAGRSVTPVTSNGEPSVVLLHDASLDEDGRLLPAVSASVRLMLDNAVLRSEVGARVAEVRAANTRVVQAADRERRRLERDLHDGAQARLVAALMALQRVDSRLRQNADGVDAQLRDTVAEADQTLRQGLEQLRELARGIHPAVLTREGVGPAVVALAERAALPVVVGVQPGRYDPVVEATAYFTVCEAVTNAAKHARARAVGVTVWRDGHQLIVEVVDDGVGGADPALGAGLQGLVDRLAAVGGVLRVESPAGGGTRLRAEMPCG